MSISKMKKELSISMGKYQEACDSYKKDPDVVKTKKAYNDALDKAREKAQEEAAPFALKSQQLRKEIAVAEEARKQSIPEKIADIISRCLRGVDYGPKGLVVDWVSPKGRFAIVRQPGHTYWANMLEPSKYAATDRNLIDAELDNGKEGSLRLFETVTIREHQGRFTNAIKAEWLDYVGVEEAKARKNEREVKKKSTTTVSRS